MEFKGTNGKYEVIEHNWSETSLMCNGKTICKFELDDIEDDDLTDSDLSEEENSYNIKLISKAPEMLEMLQKVCTELYSLDNEMATEVKKLILEATEL